MLVIGVLVSLVLWLGAAWITTALLQVPPEYRDLSVIALRIFALAVPRGMLSQILGAVPQGFQRFDLYGRLVTSIAALLIVGNGVLALAGAGLITLVAWSTATTAVGCIAFLVIANRLVPGVLFRRPLEGPAVKSLVLFGASVSARQTIGNLLLLFERAWIVRILGAGALTFYVVPMVAALSLHAFISSAALTFYPLASDAHARGDVERLRSMYTRALKCVAPKSP